MRRQRNCMCHIISQVILMILILISGNFSLVAGNGISNYKVFFAAGNFKNKNILVIRKFEQSGQQFYIAVNPDNLETQIIPSNQISPKTLTWQQILLEYKNTAYIRAIQAAQNQSFSLQNSGIIHGFPKEKGANPNH